MLLLALAPLQGFSQVAFQNSHLPQAGDTLRYSVADTFPDLAAVEASVGAARSWDYSFLEATAQRRDSFVSINSVPITIRFFFPFTANLAQYIESPDSIGGFALSGGYRMFQVSSGAFIDLGLGGTLSGAPIALVNSPTDTVITLPLSVGDADSSVSAATLNVPGLIFYEQQRKRHWQADADGQLTTPFGTFSAVRVHSTVTGRDTLAFDTLAIAFPALPEERFTWYSPDEPGELLRVSVSGQDSIRFVSGVSYRDSARNVLQLSLSAAAPSARAASIYPNPNRGTFTVDLPGANLPTTTLEVFDLQGRKVWSQPLFSNRGEVQLPQVPAGVYQVRVQSDDQVYRGRFVKQ